MLDELNAEIDRVQGFIDFIEEILKGEEYFLERPDNIEMLEATRIFLVANLKKLMHLKELEEAKQKQELEEAKQKQDQYEP